MHNECQAACETFQTNVARGIRARHVTNRGILSKRNHYQMSMSITESTLSRGNLLIRCQGGNWKQWLIVDIKAVEEKAIWVEYYLVSCGRGRFFMFSLYLSLNLKPIMPTTHTAIKGFGTALISCLLQTIKYYNLLQTIKYYNMFTSQTSGRLRAELHPQAQHWRPTIITCIVHFILAAPGYFDHLRSWDEKLRSVPHGHSGFI